MTKYEVNQIERLVQILIEAHEIKNPVSQKKKEALGKELAALRKVMITKF
jgi:hypothetical protein